MARSRRRSRRKLEPPLPEQRDELNLPKYFGMIRKDTFESDQDVGRLVLPDQKPEADRIPKAIPRGLMEQSDFNLTTPLPAEEPERVPLLLRIRRRFAGGAVRDNEAMPKQEEPPRILARSGGVNLGGDPTVPLPAEAPKKVPLLLRLKRQIIGDKLEDGAAMPVVEEPQRILARSGKDSGQRIENKLKDGAAMPVVEESQRILARSGKDSGQRIVDKLKDGAAMPVIEEPQRILARSGKDSGQRIEDKLKDGAAMPVVEEPQRILARSGKDAGQRIEDKLKDGAAMPVIEEPQRILARSGKDAGQRIEDKLKDGAAMPVVEEPQRILARSGKAAGQRIEDKLKDGAAMPVIEEPQRILARSGRDAPSSGGSDPAVPLPAEKAKKVPLLLRLKRRFVGDRISGDDAMPTVEEPPRILSGPKGANTEEQKKERLEGPERIPAVEKTPRVLSGFRTEAKSTEGLMPLVKPDSERMPLLLRVLDHFRSLLVQVEPEPPVAMPVVPEMGYPALYTRYPMMKTVTKMTDGSGEILVTYSRIFKSVPGVIITVKDPDNVFGTVFSTTITNFSVRLFKMDHDHGGVVDDGGDHTPTINADGDHAHAVQGTCSVSLDTNYGRLVLANNTDYETGHVHVQVQTQLEDKHTHHVYPTTSAGAHKHALPATDETDDLEGAFWDVTWGTLCDSGACVASLEWDMYFAASTHVHPNTGKETVNDGAHTHPNIDTAHGTTHRHLLNSTGAAPSPGHRHLISNDTLYNHYVYDVGITLDLVTSAKESPYHAHSGENIIPHGHGVPEDGRVLLKNTNVTLTYLAQEESG